MPGLKKAIPVNHRKSTQKVKSRNKKKPRFRKKPGHEKQFLGP